MRVIVNRLGGFGDMLVITSLLRYLKQEGHEVYVLTQDQGMEILKNNPNVDKLIHHKRDSIQHDKLGEYFESIKKANECDKMVELSESIEVNLALHPSDPQYKYPKYERKKICNRNYYWETFSIARKQLWLDIQNIKDNQAYEPIDDVNQKLYNPDFYSTEEEDKFIQEDIILPNIGKKKILWGLSGSARQKTYPPIYMKKVIDALPEYLHILVGAEHERILQWPFVLPQVKDQYPNVIGRAGKYTMRESITAIKYVDLLIAPDTGLLHASGCFDTPKIGILTNTSKENITKYFKNDYSIESENIGCVPCFSLIYNAQIQCNFDDSKITPICMSLQSPDKLISRIKEVLNG